MTDATQSPPPKKTGTALKWVRRVIYLLLFIAVALGLLWVLGPREPVVTSIDPASITIEDDIDAQLARQEAAVTDIAPDLQKEIVWAFPGSKAKTPVALIYVHGFSATKGETRPMPDLAAQALDANLFYTRLKGHGRTGDAMAEATVEDWMRDLTEAVLIGERLGEKVVLVTVSTGGTLAAAAALEPNLRDRIDGIVFISPNFKVKAAGSEALTMPFARTLVPLIAGERRSFEPQNEAHARYWTYEYPSVALLPMGAIVHHARNLNYQNAETPALFIFDPEDLVVDHTATEMIAGQWAGPVEVVRTSENEDPFNHVIAGDALSPSQNEPVAELIADWVGKL